MTPKEFAEKYVGKSVRDASTGKVHTVIGYYINAVVIDGNLFAATRSQLTGYGVTLLVSGDIFFPIYRTVDKLTLVDASAPTAKVETKYPHTCPTCKAPAYIGFMTVDCSKGH